MRVRHAGLVLICTLAAAVPALSQQPSSNHSAKSKKTTKTIAAFTFEAHNEGSVEGAIYDDENLVVVTIDSTGIRYQVKGKDSDRPYSIPWDQVSGWQANNFTSRSPGRPGDGDFGIGVYQGARYFSFRTRNGREYEAAIRTLRALAASKERTGMG